MRRFANMMQIVQGLREKYPEAEWQFVTLTVENCRPKALSETIDEMARAWNCIWSRRSTKKLPILGWARSLEITYNRKNMTFHPHYHVMILWDDAYSPSEYEQKWLERAWMDTVKIRTVDEAQASSMVRSYGRQMVPSMFDQRDDEAEAVLSAVLETYKYSIKSVELQEMPLGVFEILDKLIKGRRMVAFGGVVKEYAKEIGPASKGFFISSRPDAGGMILHYTASPPIFTRPQAKNEHVFDNQQSVENSCGKAPEMICIIPRVSALIH